jgi:hypothetical protein
VLDAIGRHPIRKYLVQPTTALVKDRARTEVPYETKVSYPDDYEAQVFYALTLQASASPTDTTYANQTKSAAILEKLYDQNPPTAPRAGADGRTQV